MSNKAVRIWIFDSLCSPGYPEILGYLFVLFYQSQFKSEHSVSSCQRCFKQDLEQKEEVGKIRNMKSCTEGIFTMHISAFFPEEFPRANASSAEVMLSPFAESITLWVEKHFAQATVSLSPNILDYGTLNTVSECYPISRRNILVSVLTEVSDNPSVVPSETWLEPNDQCCLGGGGEGVVGIT